MALNFTDITELPDAPQKTDPTSFASKADAFLSALESFGPELNEVIAELNTITSGLHQSTTISAYNSGTTYNFPDVVAGTNGATYRCIDTGVVDIDPVADDGSNWYNLAGADYGSAKNLIINPGFKINQRGVTSSVSLSLGEYGHDRWCGGSSDLTTVYSFSTFNNVTTVTVESGHLQQKIEGKNIKSGTVVLSWDGTATGSINGGSYGTSGNVTATLTGGSDAYVTFSAGTISNVQLEYGTSPTLFTERFYPAELALCQRYYLKLINVSILSGASVANRYGSSAVSMPVSMRSTPSVTSSWTYNTNSKDGNVSANSKTLFATAKSVAAGNFQATAEISLDAEM